MQLQRSHPLPRASSQLMPKLVFRARLEKLIGPKLGKDPFADDLLIQFAYYGIDVEKRLKELEAMRKSAIGPKREATPAETIVIGGLEKTGFEREDIVNIFNEKGFSRITLSVVSRAIIDALDGVTAASPTAPGARSASGRQYARRAFNNANADS